ncbi:unnamed protein product [Ostreobium quekettii]|uniref:5'-Nucleotidase C-terminal domain-containing protein n=1 Tax=Ostreobium quekettii TaxID=121088 RepID=A0A8S1IXW3_9CHLO|nr:unnamed protein product [Ostreobium quekettii]|eukprot:evm.model.scf_1632EXC.1 EVM.evm.TU.scf_1632EXC.1   scf_1632EXC:7580-9037(-)
MATVVRRERGKGDVLVLDAGDEFMGTIWTSTYQGRATASFLSELGVDAMALGNHEFDFGPGVLGAFLDKLALPALGANIDTSREPALDGKIFPSAKVEVAGRTVGVVGFISTDTPLQSSPGENVEFLTDLAAVVQGEVDRLREDNVTIIVGLSHAGFGVDVDLVPRLSGVDVLVGGHSHTRLEGEAYPTFVEDRDGVGVPVVQAFWAAQTVGVLNVTFSEDGALLSATGAPVVLGANASDATTFVDDDADMSGLIDMYRGDVDAFRHLAIGHTDVFLDGQVDSVRSNASNLGVMVCDAMVWKVKQSTGFEDEFGDVDVCLQNSGGITGSVDEGEVTFDDLIRVLPFGNTLAILKVTPAELYIALENGVRRWRGGQGHPEEFPQVTGIRFTFCDEMAEWEKVVTVEVFDGEKFEAVTRDANEPAINLVTNNFIAHGGDNYTVLRDAVQLFPTTGVTLDSTLLDYIMAFSPVSPEVDDRIQHACATG